MNEELVSTAKKDKMLQAQDFVEENIFDRCERVIAFLGGLS